MVRPTHYRTHAIRLTVLLMTGLLLLSPLALSSDAPASGNGKSGSKGGSGKDVGNSPFPTTRFYFQTHERPGGCVTYLQCSTSDQPTSRAAPTNPHAKVQPLIGANPQLAVYLNWLTPWNEAVTLDGDSITVTIYADAAPGPFPIGPGQATLFAGWSPGSLMHKAGQDLVYVPGTGTATPTGILNGQFTATFTDLTGGPMWKVYVYRGTERGPLDVRLDSVESPSCIIINGEHCRV